MGVQHRHKGAALLTLMDDIENVACVTAEPVKPGYYKLVTVPQKLDYGRKLTATEPATARHFF